LDLGASSANGSAVKDPRVPVVSPSNAPPAWSLKYSQRQTTVVGIYNEALDSEGRGVCSLHRPR
jgi:hypothetical protein